MLTTPPQPATIEERMRALDSAAVETLLAVAADEVDEALRAKAEQRLSQLRSADPRHLSTLVVSGSSTRVRQLAAQRIDDADEADRLGRQMRDRDKSVFRILKATSDVRRIEQQRQAQLDSDIVGACVALERFSLHLYDALYVPTFEHFEARWRAFEDKAPPDIRERARVAIDRCLAVMASHVHERMQQAEAAAADAARSAARAAAVAAADDAARAQAEQAAVAAAVATHEREALQRAQDEQRAAEAHAERQVGALIAKAHGALGVGQTGPAAGIRRAIAERLGDAPPPPSIARRLQSLDAKLHDLKEWKDYAAAPKRAELIAEMEALTGSAEPPPKLAERIRDLRDQWKTVSKGIVLETEADWQRFDRAAEAAYEPCKEYFAHQARVRAENVERRRSVLQRLLAFETAQAGEQPDWRLISQVLREARLEWRVISPVERATNKPVERDFDATLDRLQARLDGWHASNLAAKQALLERAQALLEMNNSREALAALKALQNQWRTIGTTPREQEQSLWHAFRAHCDAVYQRSQQANAEEAAGLRARHAQAMELCVNAEQLATLSGAALIEGMQSIPQWRSAFDALGELPRSEQRALHDRFERALKRCQAALAQQRARDAGQAWENLLEAGRLINSYAYAHSQGATDSAALRETAENFIAGVQQWPKPAAQALKASWAQADSARSTAGAADEEARLRTLCIRAEIHVDQPTPVEDHDLRRQYQLQRLVQSMGRPAEANPGELDDMCLEWLHVAPVSDAVYGSLLARFMYCRRNQRHRAR
ncbi:MAG: DUF349 domain-containing protein [Steroidobacteraceae bacterium]